MMTLENMGQVFKGEAEQMGLENDYRALP